MFFLRVATGEGKKTGYQSSYSDNALPNQRLRRSTEVRVRSSESFGSFGTALIKLLLLSHRPAERVLHRFVITIFEQLKKAR